MMAFVGYCLLSALLTGLYRYLALRYRWLDLPNQRSSHTVTTPRGAGLVFALLIVGACLFALPHQRALFAPLSAGLIIVAVGWYDDIRNAPASVRFVLYAVSAAAAVALAFTRQTVALQGEFALSLPWLYGVVSAIGLLWLINLYNFMDGINGIAGVEALFVLITIGVFARDTPYAQAFAEVHSLSTAAIAGFLLWNFPAGKVFMGDVGSAFLGFLIGTLMLWCALLHGPSPAVWLILLGVFVVDSSYTLIVRISTGQPWYAAHRSHAYQRLADALGSHARTVGLLMTVNLAWLLPLAWLVQNRSIGEIYGLGLAYLPLLAACFWLKAGIPARGPV